MGDPRARSLDEADLDSDPIRQFDDWYAEAEASAIELPEAMALATATRGGAPSARMVLLKARDERGFVFHTGYVSRKARELEENPHAALLFYWHVLGRQVRIEGVVERLSEEESDVYFDTRPRESRLSAIASRQSEVIGSRAELERLVAEVERRYPDGEIPRPPAWGGFRLAPELFEFWQHRRDRLHDRFRYRPDGGRWLIERLAP